MVGTGPAFRAGLGGTRDPGPGGWAGAHGALRGGLDWLGGP